MTDLKGREIGFIGLGLMGKPMARNLKAAGADMIIYNRSQGVIEELSGAGMTPAKTPADVAGAIGEDGAVIMMLPDTPVVEKVLRGPDGIVSGLVGGGGPGPLVIDMGTTKVIATRTFAKDVEAAGGQYIDAPGSGGTIGAERTAARRVIERRGIDLVVVCIAKETYTDTSNGPDALDSRLRRAEAPNWLQPLELSETARKLYRIYRVAPEAE